MKSLTVSVAYTDQCLPDYFRGDSRPWVCIPVTERGYTSRELREAIKSEFAQGATGGHDPILSDCIIDENRQALADKFYSKALQACLNRDIKYRGKRNKQDKKDDPDGEVYLYIVFNIQYDKGDE